MFPVMGLRQTAHVSTSASAISALVGEGRHDTRRLLSIGNVNGSANWQMPPRRRRRLDNSNIAKNIAATAYHGLELASIGAAGLAVLRYFRS